MEPDSRIHFDPPANQPLAYAGKRGGATRRYLEKVAKLIPIEIIGAYEAAILLVGGVNPENIRIWIYWLLFVLGIVGTLSYVGWRIGERYEKQKHLLVYGTAFVVWAYAISGHRLLSPPYHQDALAGIILIVASVAFERVKLPAKETPPKKPKTDTTS